MPGAFPTPRGFDDHPRRLQPAQFHHQLDQYPLGVLTAPKPALRMHPQVQGRFGHVNADDCFRQRHVLHSRCLWCRTPRTTLPCNTGFVPSQLFGLAKGKRRGDLAELRHSMPQDETVCRVLRFQDTRMGFWDGMMGKIAKFLSFPLISFHLSRAVGWTWGRIERVLGEILVFLAGY